MQTTFSTQLSNQINWVNEHIKLIPKAELEQKENPDKWSKKEIFGHLIDSALHNLQRFTEIPFASTTYQVRGYSQDELVKTNQYQQTPLSELLPLWNALNTQIAAVVKRLDNALLEKEISTPKGTLKHFGWLIEDYLVHLKHHLDQIFDKNQATEIQNYRISVSEALEKSKHLFKKVLEHGTMEVEIYRPLRVDKQLPHDRDELYVVISGNGHFINGDTTHHFTKGDVLFVPAGVEHRFVDFTEDFSTWVIFYGPKGGELTHNN